jgi:alkanesulfonate monooxygenase SsuD/methylene tetrahydromethanopterin reductase-like flavin-dependent oxidoreductase (luciferase family)
VQRYRQAWQAAGHSGDPTTVVRMPTLVAETQAEAQRLTENLMRRNMAKTSVTPVRK